MTCLIERRLFLWLLFVPVMLVSAFFIYTFSDNPVAQAAPSGTDNIYGWLWQGDYVGWISLNCDNDEIDSSPVNRCVSTDYGVDIDFVSGDLSGYGWSENIGWVSFEPGDLLGCDTAPSCKANVDLFTGQVTGWAKVLSSDSFIKLAGTVQTGTPYAFNFDVPTDTFDGWAYGEDYVGWISANCNNLETGDVCFSTSAYGGPSDYQMRLQTTGTAPIANFEHCVSNDLNNTVQFFDVSTDPESDIVQWSWDIDGNLIEDYSTQHPIHTYTAFAVPPFKVILTVIDNGGNQSSITIPVDPNDQDVSPLCDFNLNLVSGTSCSVVGLDWDKASGADEYEIYRGPQDILGGPYTQVGLVDAQDINQCNPLLTTCAWDDTGLIMDTDYEYYVRAIRWDGSGWNDSTGVPNIVCPGGDVAICPLSDTTPWCIPGGVTATSPACAQMLVTWNEETAPSVTGYNIYRGLIDPPVAPPLAFVSTAVCGGGLCSYSDTEILSGVEYFYAITVLADDGFGGTIEGPLSAVVSTSSKCYRGPTYIER